MKKDKLKVLCNQLCDFVEQEGEDGQICCNVCNFKGLCIGECIKDYKDCKEAQIINIK